MIIVMKPDASREDIERVKQAVDGFGCTPCEIPGAQQVTISIGGDEARVERERLLNLGGVLDVITTARPYKLVSRDVQAADTVVNVGGVAIGGRELAIIAGPCSVESREQILETAKAVRDCGARLLRGGAYKPRTSPYSFQGLKDKALEYLAEARRATGLKIVTEAKDVATLKLVAEHADMVQIGSRNMQNFSLLEAAGDLRKPVLLKRGMGATIEEFLMAAEYILSRGNSQVVLCERGIRTFETATRNTLDLNAVPTIKRLSHLPVIVDPSHGTGNWESVGAMSLAAVAAGADGLIIEVHCDPAAALSDGIQSLKPSKFRSLMERLEKLAPVVDRTLTLPKTARAGAMAAASA